MSAKDAYQGNLQNWSDMQAHLPMLYEAAKGNCLEIGVRNGMSTSALLAGIEDHGGHLWSVDINDCNLFAGHPQWTFRNGNSLLRNQVPDVAEFEVVLIDGDHTFYGAMTDLDLYGRRGKRVFVHDTDCPDTYPGVRKAVEQFIAETHRPVIWHHGSFGMAEIQ